MVWDHEDGRLCFEFQIVLWAVGFSFAPVWYVGYFDFCVAYSIILHVCYSVGIWILDPNFVRAAPSKVGITRLPRLISSEHISPSYMGPFS